jgi:hypothetical protein
LKPMYTNDSVNSSASESSPLLMVNQKKGKNALPNCWIDKL